jgi:hypothetical protein
MSKMVSFYGFGQGCQIFLGTTFRPKCEKISQAEMIPLEWVTRLGEFLVDSLLCIDNFLVILIKNCASYFCSFFTNPSGNPGPHRQSAIIMGFEPTQEKLTPFKSSN